MGTETRRYKEEALPWERQPGETSHCYNFFNKFKDMGPKRTLVALAKQHGYGRKAMTRMYYRWAWKERVMKWEQHLENEKMMAQVEAIQQMGIRQAKQAEDIANLMFLPIKTFIERNGITPGRLDKLTDKALMKLAIKAAKEWPNMVKTERLVRGESTESIDQNISGGLNSGHASDTAKRILDDPETRELVRWLYRKGIGGNMGT